MRRGYNAALKVTQRVVDGKHHRSRLGGESLACELPSAAFGGRGQLRWARESPSESSVTVLRRSSGGARSVELERLGSGASKRAGERRSLVSGTSWALCGPGVELEKKRPVKSPSSSSMFHTAFECSFEEDAGESPSSWSVCSVPVIADWAAGASRVGPVVG